MLKVYNASSKSIGIKAIESKDGSISIVIAEINENMDVVYSGEVKNVEVDNEN